MTDLEAARIKLQCLEVVEDALQKIQVMPAPCEPKFPDMQIFNQWEASVRIARNALSTTCAA